MTLCLNFSQEVIQEPTIVSAGSIVFSNDEFDALLVTLHTCVQKDSLIAVQDSLIKEYQYKETLTPSLWEQDWFRNLLFSILGASLTKVVDNNVK